MAAEVWVNWKEYQEAVVVIQELIKVALTKEGTMGKSKN